LLFCDLHQQAPLQPTQEQQPQQQQQ